MDLHKPKSWHGVREFLKAYLIIVVDGSNTLKACRALGLLDPAT